MPDTVYGWRISPNGLEKLVGTLSKNNGSLMIVLCYAEPHFGLFDPARCSALVSESTFGWVFSEAQELRWRRVGNDTFAVAWCTPGLQVNTSIPKDASKLPLPDSVVDTPVLLWGQEVDGDGTRRWEAQVPRVFDLSFLNSRQVVKRLSLKARHYTNADGSVEYWRLAGFDLPSDETSEAED